MKIIIEDIPVKLTKRPNGSPLSICSIDGCLNKAPCKGLCEKHRGRLRRHGSPSALVKPRLRGVDEKNRFEYYHVKKENGCWLWVGGTRANAKGMLYGRISRNDGSSIGAHRLSYIIHKGDIPKGLMVCHTCDTPLCVNPDHLFLGTHKDNMKDMVSKNRSYKGRGEDKKGLAKLTNSQAEVIRNSSKSQYKLARIYNVSQTTIGRIKRGVSY